MSAARFRIDPLSRRHQRENFRCGSEPLNRYFRDQVSQDIRRRVGACFVALDENERIAGFYTLSATSVMLSELPEALSRKLPRYPTIPAVRMGRLAVDKAFEGQGLGGALLADALIRSIRSEIAAYAMVVDAKDDAAVAYYRHHGFFTFSSQPLKLFLPLVTASRLLGTKREDVFD